MMRAASAVEPGGAKRERTVCGTRMGCRGSPPHPASGSPTPGRSLEGWNWNQTAWWGASCWAEWDRSLKLWFVRVLSCFRCVRLFATLWTTARQAPHSIGFSRQEYWSGLSCSPPGDLPDPGMKPASLMSPTLADRFFTTSATWETLSGLKIRIFHIQKLIKYFIRCSAEEAESFI